MSAEIFTLKLSVSIFFFFFFPENRVFVLCSQSNEDSSSILWEKKERKMAVICHLLI